MDAVESGLIDQLRPSAVDDLIVRMTSEMRRRLPDFELSAQVEARLVTKLVETVRFWLSDLVAAAVPDNPDPAPRKYKSVTKRR